MPACSEGPTGCQEGVFVRLAKQSTAPFDGITQRQEGCPSGPSLYEHGSAGTSSSRAAARVQGSVPCSGAGVYAAELCTVPAGK